MRKLGFLERFISGEKKQSRFMAIKAWIFGDITMWTIMKMKKKKKRKRRIKIYSEQCVCV